MANGRRIKSKKGLFPGERNFIVNRQQKNDGNYKNFTISESGIPTDPALIDSMLSFPDFSKMSCIELETTIKALSDKLNEQRLTIKNQDWLNAYQTAIENAQAEYKSKGCQMINAGAGTDGGAAINTDTTNSNNSNSAKPVTATTADGKTTVIGTAADTASSLLTGIPWKWVGIAAGALVLYLIVSNSGASLKSEAPGPSNVGS